MYKENCIFCKIASGEIPSKFIFENDNIVAFNDINPKAPTHILVIPKKHYENLDDIDDIDLMAEMLCAIKEITKKHDIKHYQVVTNNGKGAGQEVFHLHFHIMAQKKID